MKTYEVTITFMQKGKALRKVFRINAEDVLNVVNKIYYIYPDNQYENLEVKGIVKV